VYVLLDTASDGATSVDLVHHRLLPTHSAVLGDGGVGVLVDGCTWNTESLAGHAGARGAGERRSREVTGAVLGLVLHACVDRDT
jgi:hypothetical protein